MKSAFLRQSFAIAAFAIAVPASMAADAAAPAVDPVVKGKVETYASGDVKIHDLPFVGSPDVLMPWHQAHVATFAELAQKKIDTSGATSAESGFSSSKAEVAYRLESAFPKAKIRVRALYEFTAREDAQLRAGSKGNQDKSSILLNGLDSSLLLKRRKGMAKTILSKVKSAIDAGNPLVWTGDDRIVRSMLPDAEVEGSNGRKARPSNSARYEAWLVIGYNAKTEEIIFRLPRKVGDKAPVIQRAPAAAIGAVTLGLYKVDL